MHGFDDSGQVTFGENGAPEPSVDFDYSEVDRNLGTNEPEYLTRQEHLCEQLRRLGEWIYGDGDKEGIVYRVNGWIADTWPEVVCSEDEKISIRSVARSQKLCHVRLWRTICAFEKEFGYTGVLSDKRKSPDSPEPEDFRDNE